MKKKYKLLIISVLVVFVGYIIVNFIMLLKYTHLHEFDNLTKYDYLFSDEYKDKKNDISSEFYRKSDSYYRILCSDKLVSILRIPDLDKLNLDSIIFNTNINLNDLELYSSQIINSELEDSPLTTILEKIPFKKNLVVNFNEETKIIEKFKGGNYLGFYGKFNKMSFSNKEGKHLMLFDYRGEQETTLLVFTRKRNQLFIIIVNSENEFGMEAKEMFNLE